MSKRLKVVTIECPDESIHHDGSSGLLHLDAKYAEAEEHPEILKHKPVSPYGDAYLAKFDSSDCFAWTKPVHGGYYRSCNPVFLISA